MSQKERHKHTGQPPNGAERSYIMTSRYATCQTLDDLRKADLFALFQCPTH